MDSFHESVRAGMMRARDAMNAGLWRQAIAELEQVVVAAHAERAGHAEALWALAVCRDALGETRAAMDSLDASIAMDPTALTPHETRLALTERLRDCATDRSRPLRERRAAVEVLARHTARATKRAARPRGRRKKLAADDRRVLRLLLDR